jgi:hypothetical protein
MPLLLPGAEPFFLPDGPVAGSPVGALAPHSFTGAPRAMCPLAFVRAHAHPYAAFPSP